MTKFVFILLAISVFGYIALCDEASAQKQLAASRQQIDTIDRQIVNLINQRAAIVKKIGQIKSAAGLPVAAPHREQDVLRHVADMGASGPFPTARLKAIYASVLTQMREWEQEQHHPAK